MTEDQINQMMMDPEMQGVWMASIMGTYLIAMAIFYVWTSICFQKIAAKTNTPNGWLAWIPIANLVLLLQIAKRPLWWIILLIIPLVNLVVSIIVMMDVIKARGKEAWQVVLMILFGPFYLGYLAFSK